MAECRPQRWIIRSAGGPRVYYPSTWSGGWALQAYVVGDPRVVRRTIRRKRVAFLGQLVFGVLGVIALVAVHPEIALVAGLVPGALLSRWVTAELRVHAVRLPRRLAVDLAADKQEDLEMRMQQVASLFVVSLASGIVAFDSPLLLIGSGVFLGAILLDLIVSWRMWRQNRAVAVDETMVAAETNLTMS